MDIRPGYIICFREVPGPSKIAMNARFRMYVRLGALETLGSYEIKIREKSRRALGSESEAEE